MRHFASRLLIQAGGICGIRGSIGPLVFGSMLVESRAVRPPCPRPGSRPFRASISCPGLCPEYVRIFAISLYVANVTSSATTKSARARNERLASMNAPAGALSHFPGTCELHRGTGIETSHRAHNINALEVFRPIFFEQWRVLNGILRKVPVYRIYLAGWHSRELEDTDDSSLSSDCV